MQTINDYIIERIRIDNIKHPEFPIDGKIDDMANFLENYNFEEVEDSYDYETVKDIFAVFNKCKNKCYMMDISKRKWIRICDTSKGKISENNPCVFISCETKKRDLERPKADENLSNEKCLEYLKEKFNI